MLSGPLRGTEEVISAEVFRIGKAPENDLVLDDPTVSRAHCEIIREPKGYLIRDLGSTNGTQLDGGEIKEAYVKPGALITVGDIELRLRPYSERIETMPSEATRFGEAVGRSLRMREIFGLLERLAPTDATILLGGETGTGKDVLARSAHAASKRNGKPFMIVDCGAVVGSLIESELFGHEKGSFTGANATRQGAFELAHTGTLFLDEIGELPLDLQPKLLRAIEQRTIRRVGGNKDMKIDIRIIAASKRNLRMEVERGKFREDLFFRLAVVQIDVPPLRERREDVPLIAEELLKTFGDPPMEIQRKALEALASHEWPGNIRELRNVLERAVYLARSMGDTTVPLEALPMVAQIEGPTGSGAPLEFTPGRSYRETRAEWDEMFERSYVTWLLERHEGNVSAAARDAEMDRKHLHHLAKKHGLRGGD